MRKKWLVINLNNKYFLKVGKKVFGCQIGNGGFNKSTKKSACYKTTNSGWNY